MKISILKILLLCTFFVFISCEKEQPIPKSKAKPKIAGVILSFDDAYINEWFATNQQLKKYGWKGTFFVCRIHNLKHYQIKKLLELQNEGHEIGGHGLNHLNAADYTRVHTINEYMKDEINPMLHLMHFYGLKVSSFAYPYGGRTQKLDAALLKKFKVVRGRAFNEEVADKQGCYFNHSNLIFSFSIDDTHNDFNIPHLLKLLDFAKKHNKILILNSHKTVNEVTGDYQTENKTLEYVCQYVKRNKLRFYTVSDLNKFQ
ncbi:polysaccharide deacetylase family protein [Flavobacterium eburneipallidum]|uniref:polysaccharide deacetylase family protein n=1 Tax=Flavobacterium eburneipallidum TaxID=3003263 RepID=UPI0022ABE47B|nr:polysaccharide deacetylase family protein [Flavobacterium eburneipallidum]